MKMKIGFKNTKNTGTKIRKYLVIKLSYKVKNRLAYRMLDRRADTV